MFPLVFFSSSHLLSSHYFPLALPPSSSSDPGSYSGSSSPLSTRIVYNVAQPSLSNHNMPYTQWCLQRKKVGIRTTGGAVLINSSRGSIRISSSTAEAGVCSSGSNSSTAHGTGAGSVSLCVCLVDQLPENRYTRTAAFCSKNHTVLVNNVAQHCLVK